jgi:RNA polymerase sigma factor (sigma-70 family)
MNGRRRREAPILRARDHPDSFDDVFVAYHESVLRFLVRRTFDPEVAFDLAAETFTRMLARISTFEGLTESHGQAWMWAIARSQLNQWYERGRVERRYRERMLGDLRAPGQEELERIEELADIEPLRPRLGEALEALAGPPRRVLRLRIVEQWSYDEIAEELGVTANAARIRVARALALFTENFHGLEDEGSHPGHRIS